MRITCAMRGPMNAHRAVKYYVPISPFQVPFQVTAPAALRRGEPVHRNRPEIPVLVDFGWISYAIPAAGASLPCPTMPKNEALAPRPGLPTFNAATYQIPCGRSTKNALYPSLRCFAAAGRPAARKATSPIKSGRIISHHPWLAASAAPDASHRARDPVQPPHPPLNNQIHFLIF